MAWHWRGEPAGWLAFELALARGPAESLQLNGAVFALNRLCAGSKQ